jgi:hypothetical protein
MTGKKNRKSFPKWHFSIDNLLVTSIYSPTGRVVVGLACEEGLLGGPSY